MYLRSVILHAYYGEIIVSIIALEQVMFPDIYYSNWQCYSHKYTQLVEQHNKMIIPIPQTQLSAVLLHLEFNITLS